MFADCLVVAEMTHYLGNKSKEKNEVLFESLLRIKELKDLRNSKFDVEKVMILSVNTTADFEEDTEKVHNMFTIKQNANSSLTLIQKN